MQWNHNCSSSAVYVAQHGQHRWTLMEVWSELVDTQNWRTVQNDQKGVAVPAPAQGVAEIWKSANSQRLQRALDPKF